MGISAAVLRHTHRTSIEPTDGELRINAAVLVRPLSNRGAKSGEEGKEEGYEEETRASRIHKGRREGAAPLLGVSSRQRSDVGA